MDVSDEYALWQSLGHWSVYAEWFVALLLAAAVASAWRGAWLVLDATLWPQRPPLHPRACLATLTARPGSAPEENHPLRPGARADLDAMASIFDAAASGDIGAMNGFMDADDFEVDAKDALGNTALHCAAKNGEAAAGGLLVECSADVNLEDAHGNTALILAAIHDKRLVASMLLWGGAERDLQNKRGNTALHEAAISGAKDVVYLIVENGGERSVRIKNEDGKTPLDLAHEKGASAELIELPAASAALGLGWGVVLFGILGFLQPCLAAVANRVRHRRVLWLVDAAYSYAGFWCCVLVWRGAWQLWDAALGFLPESHETGPANMRGAWMSHWVGVFVVLCAGGLRSLNAPPMLILSDTLPPLFGARATCGLRGFSRPLVRCREPPQLMPCQKWHEVVGLPFHSQEPKGCEATPEANASPERLAALLLEVEHHGGDGRKKLSPEEIEQKKKEAEELGDKFRQLSKKERSEINKTRKERAGQRLAKTGSKSRKFEGEDLDWRFPVFWPWAGCAHARLASAEQDSELSQASSFTAIKLKRKGRTAEGHACDCTDKPTKKEAEASPLNLFKKDQPHGRRARPVLFWAVASLVSGQKS
eukprot:g16063.t1